MNQDEPPIRVLVADDQILIRAGVAALIRATPGMDVVGEAADGDEAVRLAQAHHPDVVLMDIRMPVLDGVEATRRLLADDAPHRPHVLVLTTFDLDEYVYSALKAGADGFLLKDIPPQRLLSAVRTVAEGNTLLDPHITRRLVEAHTRPLPPPAVHSPTLAPLTARESEVLSLVAKGLTNAEIADRLMMSESTVKTHLNRTMTKLDLSSRAQAVVIAYETGLVRPSGPSTNP
ncbi:response regulator [Streptantibioticus cattleyicolor]|uniref:Two-component system regulator n=1 Tax=Streptantibioticus cattleyicolor (strain ATCC 35852 / DSM 46488 / JCM 4925 / NBRC 14057 / NRRL 8057) TaxID=1003195 RepID=F8JME1_STREN|nr:response regulator transcription factor [Streptantibioticus cattleyicolor]AEW99379.1 two-component system regulator [Streptantibioticus cattleyicolor NRRL 8057 = DSM 46488]CCB71579.1 Uncharacterized transcriptional regulatory protein yxjL [Streptantibioticus cattleyicolor NRRL 8057 = DSM 46488]